MYDTQKRSGGETVHFTLEWVRPGDDCPNEYHLTARLSGGTAGKGGGGWHEDPDGKAWYYIDHDSVPTAVEILPTRRAAMERLESLKALALIKMLPGIDR